MLTVLKNVFKVNNEDTLTLSCTMLKNGQTYFKNLAVWTRQDFYSMLGHFLTLYMKRGKFNVRAKWVTPTGVFIVNLEFIQQVVQYFNPFHVNVTFINSPKQTTSTFLIFLGDIEREYIHKMS